MKYLLCCLVLFSGCYYASSSVVPSLDTRVYNQSNVDYEHIDSAVKKFRKTMGVSRSDLSISKIQITPAPICMQEDTGYTLADGITYVSEGEIVVIVSTVQGCFDSLVHELGHVLQLNRDHISDRNHNDKFFWNRIKQVEEWVRKNYCKDTYKQLTPEEAATKC